MPIFEFTCAGCGSQFEEILSLAELEAGDFACPDCGAKKAQRNISGFAQGSGTVTAGGAPCGAPRGGCGTGGFG